MMHFFPTFAPNILKRKQRHPLMVWKEHRKSVPSTMDQRRRLSFVEVDAEETNRCPARSTGNPSAGYADGAFG
jgi:hypothetical protein